VSSTQTSIVFIVLAITLAEIGCSRAGGQVPRSDQRSDQKEVSSFHAVSELTKPMDAQVTLRGARLATPGDWPASFYSIHPTGTCTSTLIGPRALLTTAHCAPNASPVLITWNQIDYRGTCLQSDLYSPSSDEGESADWAMCLMETDVPVPQYETINLDPTRINVGVEVLLTGFGCTQANGTGGNEHVYRIGEAKVSGTPSGKSNYITTSGEVATCFGDSGGAAFLFLDAAKKTRVQVSVNSRITLHDGRLGADSYLSSISTNGAQAFIRKWSSSTGAAVCGIAQNLQHCRD
jgi:hypothetical protein